MCDGLAAAEDEDDIAAGLEFGSGVAGDGLVGVVDAFGNVGVHAAFHQSPRIVAAVVLVVVVPNGVPLDVVGDRGLEEGECIAHAHGVRSALGRPVPEHGNSMQSERFKPRLFRETPASFIMHVGRVIGGGAMC